jgi:hypothetical protein
VLEIFGCLHHQTNDFLPQCVNMTWNIKILKSPLSILHSFYKQRMSMALQQVQGTSISKHAFTIGEGSSKLNHLPLII